MEEKQEEWFRDWFDSPYYHLLYNHRDTEEAAFFLDHLIEYLEPRKGAEMLDLACGRGRHAIHLHKRGFDVSGIDLSPSNIAFASSFSDDRMHFFVHDMRNLFSTNRFDFVFNLFTSFGYFDREAENVRVIKNVRDCLKPGGKFVLDFLNVELLKEHERIEERRQVQGIDFLIQKERRGAKFVKTIFFKDQGHAYSFSEQLSLLTLSDFNRLFRLGGLHIQAIFGDYSLNTFEASHSPRLILVAEK